MPGWLELVLGGLLCWAALSVVVGLISAAMMRTTNDRMDRWNRERRRGPWER